MRKIITLFISAFAIVLLWGCQTSTPSIPSGNAEKTNYELVEEAIKNLNLGDLNKVRLNLVLPRKLEHEILVTWSVPASDKAYINDEGHVTRPNNGDGNVKVSLFGTFELGGTTRTKQYDLNILEYPATDDELLNEVIDTFVLVENNTVTRDYLILPRVTDYYMGTITWETGNSNIIDTDGFVKQTDVDQQVTLIAEFKIGDASKSKPFPVTVKAKQTTKYDVINEQDDRILNKVYVRNQQEFLIALNNSKAGDAIILENGNFENINYVLRKSGTEKNPIFIFAKEPGKAIITGESQIEIVGNHVIMANLTFANGFPATDRGVILLNGNHLRLTNTLVKEFEFIGYDYKWISMTGKYHEVDNNTFDGKITGGALLTIWRDDNGPQYHTIHHNQFKNYKNAGGANGYETIRVGTSTYSQSDSFVLIEDNLFESVNGEIEIISIKAGRTHVRNNTFVKSVGLITARHGKNSVIENNVFFCDKATDSGGIRAYDGGHVIRNNYIEQANTSSNTRAGIVIHSGVNKPGTNTTLNAQWTPYNLLIINNTLYDCKQSILFDGKYSEPSTDVKIIGNLIVATANTSAVRYDKEHKNLTFKDNFFYSDLSYAGGGTFPTMPLPSEGITFTKGLLTLPKNSQGLNLHETIGAQNLEVMSGTNTGVSWLK